MLWYKGPNTVRVVEHVTPGTAIFERPWALFLCPGSTGKSEAKPCSARSAVSSPQAAAMRFDNGSADGQPQTSTVNLGGEESIEYLVRLLRGQSQAGIADGHQNKVIFLLLRFDGKFARSVYVFHRIDAIHDEVHHDLLQLHTISYHLGKARR